MKGRLRIMAKIKPSIPLSLHNTCSALQILNFHSVIIWPSNMLQPNMELLGYF